MSNKKEHLFYFLFVSISFFAVRFTTYPQVYINDFLNLIDPDSYYHLRRVIYTINNFPEMLNFDPFLSYPYGDYCPWPPLYDFISALIVKTFGNNIKIIPFLNPIYFFIALSIIHFSLTQKEGVAVALTTATFISLTGVLYLYTSFGRFDHHALELLIITLIYLTFLRYYTKKDIPSLLLFSLFTTLSFFNWPGAIIYFLPIILYLLFELIRERLPNNILKGIFIAFHICAISIAIYLKITERDNFPPYSYKFLSAFQRDSSFLISIIFLTIFFYKTKKINKYFLLIGNVFIVALMFHKLFYEVFKGLMFITKGDRLMILIEESSPLFFSKFYTRLDEFKRAISLFTPFIFFFPYFLYIYWKKRGTDLIIIFNTFFLLLTLFQLRFGYFFMMGYSVLISIALKETLDKHKKFLLTLLIILTIFIFLRDFNKSQERFLDEEIRKSLIFLRQHTPEKEKFERGETPYGVLASWHLGHHIIEFAKRPVIAHNFINVALKNGEKEFINALFSKSEKEVISIMDKNKAKFLILEKPDGNIITDWYAISKEKNPFTDEKNNINSNASSLFIFNLYYFYGIIPPFEKTPENIRLIYESSGNKNNLKIFERVKSAKIVFLGKGTPILKLLIKTPYNKFFHISLGEQSKEGTIFTVPYSLNSPYPVNAESIYLEVNGKKIPIHLSETDISEGKVISVKE